MMFELFGKMIQIVIVLIFGIAFLVWLSRDDDLFETRSRKLQLLHNNKKRDPNSHAYKSIVKKYNLSKARKIEAVEVAVNYILNQQMQRDWQAEESSGLITAKPNRKGKKFSDCKNNLDCPICNVSITAILMDGMFVHQPQMTAPPYDYYCWSMRVRYHVAPKCAEEELSRNVEPIYKWKWTLKAAEDGYCRMPEDSPAVAGSLYQDRIHQLDLQEQSTKEAPAVPLTKRKETTVLLLGLSFLSEPYMSLGCLYKDKLSNAYARSQLGTRFYENLADITANNGQCTGYKVENIVDFFPPDLHPNVKIPTQNFPMCTMDASYMEFSTDGKKSESFSTNNIDDDGHKITFCYQYTFNVDKNVKKGSPLPCNIPSWSDVDIVLSFFSGVDMALYVDRTGWSKLVLENRNRMQQGLPEHKVRFFNVEFIYENVIVRQLKSAYIRGNFTPLFEREDFLSKYNQCGQGAAAKADIHYRAPGIPDFAAKMWLAMIATGIELPEDKQFQQVILPNNTLYREGMKFWL